MAKFNYKMQNILNVKINLETQAKSAFAEASEKLRIEEVKLERIYADIKGYEEHIRQINQSRLDILELSRCNKAISLKQDEAKLQQKVIQKAEKNLELARVKLSKVMIERKTQEKLKERAFEEFLKELEAEEKKEIDEVVSFQYNKSE